jgi:hypothetical protein
VCTSSKVAPVRSVQRLQQTAAEEPAHPLIKAILLLHASHGKGW